MQQISDLETSIFLCSLQTTQATVLTCYFSKGWPGGQGKQESQAASSRLTLAAMPSLPVTVVCHAPGMSTRLGMVRPCVLYTCDNVGVCTGMWEPAVDFARLP